MNTPQISPYGSWRSPVTPDLIVAGTVSLSQIMIEGDAVYWVEGRPEEGGRNVIVRWTEAGGAVDLTPPGFNARTRVHEYGGGAYTVVNGELFFSHFDDQQLYQQPAGELPRPVTAAANLRYADMTADGRGHLLAIREDHSGAGEAVNALVSLDMSGGEDSQVLASGHDFYASPRLSPDGRRLAWLSWNHPNMPWDGTELWLGEVQSDGSLSRVTLVAGGKTESIFQPEWSPDGVLHFVSDRTGWWNLYRWRDGQVEAIHEMAAEFGQPQWLFGLSTYAFTAEGAIIAAYTQNGFWSLARLGTADAGAGLKGSDTFEALELPYSFIHMVKVSGRYAVLLAGSATTPVAVIRIDLATRRVEVLRSSSSLAIDPAYVSIPQAIEFSTAQAQTAHAFFYPPHNDDYQAPEEERPPLLVISHGGPTSASSATFNPGIQFWTSRGFAVLDVNYGGSTGYGRAYRQRLNGQWGIVDVDDCVNGARYLVAAGLADGQRLAIRGGSAGGYTTLAALTFRDVFSAGASHFGISDLEAMAQETHKMESRYLDSLIGPYPERRDLYLERSPVHFVDQINCALILFQGLEDEVVPPNQAEMMYDAVRAKGLPVAYIAFPGEQHGFRRAETIQRALNAELYFYSQVFTFNLADTVEPVTIENLG
jgi:dipeptidyl aminopeptidase/acylaminoacyl peptidase